jgi:hypothetical protein
VAFGHAGAQLPKSTWCRPNQNRRSVVAPDKSISAFVTPPLPDCGASSQNLAKETLAVLRQYLAAIRWRLTSPLNTLTLDQPARKTLSYTGEDKSFLERTNRPPR